MIYKRKSTFKLIYALTFYNPKNDKKKFYGAILIRKGEHCLKSVIFESVPGLFCR